MAGINAALIKLRISVLASVALVACAAEREPPAGGDNGSEITGWFAVLGPEARALPAGVAVYNPEDHAQVHWEGLAGERFALPPGRYDVLLEYFGQRYWRRGVDLAAGETRIQLPMATFTLEARSSRGEALAGVVTVYPAGGEGGPPVMESATFETMAVLAGTYDVQLNVQGRERWFRGVTMEEDEVVSETAVEAVGYLKVETVGPGGALLPAEVTVYGSASRRMPVAAGYGGETITLVPGRYDVAIRWRRWEDYAAGVAVFRNQTTLERITIPQWEEP